MSSAPARLECEVAQAGIIIVLSFLIISLIGQNSVTTSTIQIPPPLLMYEKTHMSLVKSSRPVNYLICKYSGHHIDPIPPQRAKVFPIVEIHSSHNIWVLNAVRLEKGLVND